MTAFISGLAFGLFGSGHCVVMCGPLASLPVAERSRVAYHAGRMLTYLALGLLAGTFGAGASAAGAGRVLAIASGLGLIAMAVGRGRHSAGAVSAPSGLTRLLGRASLARRGGKPLPSWTFGALNGLLPCGLVYAAVVGAMGFGTVTDAVVFLTAFGAGTVPLLAATALVGSSLSARLRTRFRLAGTVALVTVGILLVLRGAVATHVHADAARPEASETAGPAHAGPHH